MQCMIPSQLEIVDFFMVFLFYFLQGATKKLLFKDKYLVFLKFNDFL
jgi:hypothetical protein